MYVIAPPFFRLAMILIPPIPTHSPNPHWYKKKVLGGHHFCPHLLQFRVPSTELWSRLSELMALFSCALLETPEFVFRMSKKDEPDALPPVNRVSLCTLKVWSAEPN